MQQQHKNIQETIPPIHPNFNEIGNFNVIWKRWIGLITMVVEGFMAPTMLCFA